MFDVRNFVVINKTESRGRNQFQTFTLSVYPQGIKTLFFARGFQGCDFQKISLLLIL